jgi:hypothetical protein
VYAAAASALSPGADTVEAYYWFVGQHGAIELRGAVIDDEAGARFRQVLSTIVSGIDAGHFPARPGNERWLPGRGTTFDNCRFCDYDRVCSSQRAEQWLELRSDPTLASYVALAEPEADAAPSVEPAGGSSAQAGRPVEAVP